MRARSMPRMARRCMPHPRASGASVAGSTPRRSTISGATSGTSHPEKMGTPLSAELTSLVAVSLETLNANEAARTALRAAPPAIRDSIQTVFAASDFVAQSWGRDAQCLAGLIDGGDLQRSLAAADFAARAPRPADLATPEAHFQAELRRWRRRELTRIAWRDLTGWADLSATFADLTAFADAAIGAALSHARRALVARYGEPRSAAGEVQPLVVIGMGKLGGGELNFSSDVDLVLLFPEHGETDGPRGVANEEFFTRLGQALVRLLETPTSEGFVLRVDLRLRPFGDSGPLVASFASFEDYLPRHGRDWERYAYVKARPVTCAERYAEIDAAAIRPFVYRRYLDYGVFESLREMKTLIEREMQRRELADHVKLGPGGIREIEFIVQALQLTRGGRDPRLQTPSLLAALACLGESQLLPAEATSELRAAYIYLRRLENRLQMLADAQVHSLPAEPLARERLALAMGAHDWAALTQELNAHRARVSRHFRLLVQGGAEPDRGAVRIDLGRFWDSQAETAALAEALARAGFTDNAEVARLLLELRASALVRKLDEPGRKRLQALLPALLADVAGSSAQLPVLRRILAIIEATGKRSAYFALLRENGAARARLVQLCRHGDFLAAQIAAHPLLLDELIDARLLSQPPTRAGFARELESRMEQLRTEDPEQQVEALRQFQCAALFRVAVADLTGVLPLMQVSDRLTDIAELIVERALQLGWRQISAQFGVPTCGDGEGRRPVAICAVGYGKLGGMELGYGSDLDLVFLHDSHGEQQETSGARPIDNQLFFVRLAQRIVHLLTMHSAAGRLYEVDVRLRPSGKGGLLVTNIEAFADYQRREAWTWEHQALLHARAVAGAPELCARFERVRLEVLCEHVRRDSLREEVRNMRERQRRELSAGDALRFDIKQDPGGIADIEFLAQYWALMWAREYPPVAMFSDTIRQLESVASANLVPQASVDLLTGAYREYRAATHLLSLEDAAPIVPAADFRDTRAAVIRLWNAALAPEAQGAQV
ncbi:MAG: bifunctional [glutamate--ammonia ligase]-adenylyl-L-tyrosine phosphorylase/[glutamate--ammonia-ligase] adenylyltransferase [Gammaproteobacteria bacterium]|nr:MAG: bifunctional [glutamate--ammonia ligase]-adenylyl-L-tyrosine phosphorylase/[glutamate--ammonia-ligase] adenylyltransferase [Gammaproteobacteria bacterium]